MIKVVDKLPKEGKGSAASTGDVTDADAVRRALEALASSEVATSAVESAHAVSNAVVAAPAGTRGEAAGAALCSAVRGLELGAHGAYVATLLHQEKLDKLPTGAQPLSNGADRLLMLVREIRQRLAAARERRFEHLMPAGLSAAVLLAAVNSNKVTVDLLASGAAGPAARMAAVVRAWPAAMAMMRSVHPRDVDEHERAFLEMARELGACSADGVRVEEVLQVVAGEVFERMAGLYREYLRGVGDGVPPS